MHFSAGVVFTWGWFGGSSWTSGWLTQMCCSALFLVRWPQTHSHSERDLKIEMFPAWGRPRERLELWFSAFLLELRQCPCSCGFSPTPKLGTRCSAAESPGWLCKWCLCCGRKRKGKGNLTGKRLQSPPMLFPLSLPCGTCTQKCLHI